MTMYLLNLFLPFISAFILLGFGRYIGPKGSILFSTCSLALSFIISSLLLLNAFSEGLVYFCNVGMWIESVGPLLVKWEFQFDVLSLAMMSMVTFISMLVHIYSWSYMEADPFLIRFLGLLSLFTFFMLVLLTSSNFLQLFLGWEGIGICSYFLIGFWYTRVQANKAALKAMIVNRVGDIALLISMGLLVYEFRSLDFNVIFTLIPLYSGVGLSIGPCLFSSVECICFFLLLAAVGKSAQIGLHIWLPDAMEGPTPVSALIHAATMVTAGIFLIARCSFIFEYAPTSLLIITILGALTAFFAASSGLVQNDIKKVIAYSTCSQLGYMFYACGLSNYVGSVFHLINHAFFKALLFLSAGSVIHALNNEQDMRKMGSLVSIIPITYISLIVGSLALAGFPFLDGFYSKDFILEFSLIIMNLNAFYTFAFVLTSITAVITFVYSIRLLYLVFWSPSNTTRAVFSNAHESGWVLLTPLLILITGSLFFGYITKDIFIGSGSSLWNNSLIQLPRDLTTLDVENLLNFKFLLFCIIFGSGVFIVGLLALSNYKLRMPQNIVFHASTLLNFLGHKWYFDYIWNNFVEFLFNYSYTVWLIIDKGVLEFLQPIALTESVFTMHSELYWKRQSNLNFYSVTSLLFFIMMFVIYFFSF